MQLGRKAKRTRWSNKLQYSIEQRAGIVETDISESQQVRLVSFCQAGECFDYDTFNSSCSPELLCKIIDNELVHHRHKPKLWTANIVIVIQAAVHLVESSVEQIVEIVDRHVSL